MLSGSQARITEAILQAREVLPHPGEKGAAIERIFRSHLRDVLPEKVGVAHGFVLDLSDLTGEYSGYLLAEHERQSEDGP